MTQNEIESEIIPDETENETGSEPDQDQTEAESPNAEAKRYRLQLRQVEGERDQLTGQLDAARRQIVEGHASRTLYRPEGLWAAGIQPADMFDADGQLDTDKLGDAITDAAGRLGLTRRPVAGPWQGKGNGPRAGEHGHRGDFSDAFRPRG